MTHIKKYPLAVAGMLAAMTLAPGDAKADEYCREYTRTIQIGGRIQEGYGTACLMPDGDWQVRNEQVRSTVQYYQPAQGVVYYPQQTAYYRQQPVRVVFYDNDRRWHPPGKHKGWHKAHYRDRNHHGRGRH